MAKDHEQTIGMACLIYQTAPMLRRLLMLLFAKYQDAGYWHKHDRKNIEVYCADKQAFIMLLAAKGTCKLYKKLAFAKTTTRYLRSRHIAVVAIYISCTKIKT